jgi:hypothetical protein
MPSFIQPWRPELNWETPAGQVLDRLVDALPSNRNWDITVFGSAPLQLGLDSSFLSADVDVIPTEDITGFCRAAQLLEGQAPIYVEPCTFHAFTASPDWSFRAFRCQRRHVSLLFPHPIDILVSKVKRLDEKDLRAFRMVRAKTGHPTESELITALQRVVDIYRPSFDEESAGDPLHNTQVLWQELFGKAIDVRREIISPALEERRRSYGGGAGLKDALRRVMPAGMPALPGQSSSQKG